MARKLSNEQRLLLADAIERALHKLDWSKTRLARTSGYDDRTIRNIMSGHSAKYETYAEVCKAAQIDIEAILEAATAPLPTAAVTHAPALLGGYSREMYEHLVGEYVTIRPKYNEPAIIKSYMTRIYWAPRLGHYCFEEANRIDAEFSQSGHVYIPLGGPCLYLMTIDKGWVRMVMVSQIIRAATEMRGLIASQYNITGPAYGPVASPIAYCKIGPSTEFALGELRKGDTLYDRYLGILQDTLQGTYAQLAVPPMPERASNVVPLQPKTA